MKALAFAFALLPALGGAARAAQGWRLDLQPSYVLPVQASDKVFKPSLGLIADLDYYPAPWFSLGASLNVDRGFHMDGVSYTHTLGDVDHDGIPDRVRFTSDINAPMVGLAALLKLHQSFSVLGRTLTLSESGGAGMFGLFTNAGYLTLYGKASSGADVTGMKVFIPKSGNGYFTGVFGLALDMPLAGGFSAGAALRYEDISNHDFDSFLAASLRVSLALPREKTK